MLTLQGNIELNNQKGHGHLRHQSTSEVLYFLLIYLFQNCIDGIQEALDKEEYEKAAQFVKTYLNIDHSVLQPDAAAQLQVASQK